MKAEGASEIIGFDIDETRREYARPLLSHIINPTSDEGKRLPLRNQAAPLLDVSMDCIGVRESVEYLMDHTKEIVSLFGVQRENYTYGPGHWGLKIFGYPGHYREAAEYALRKITDASLNLKFLVTHQMKLEEYKDAVELLKTKCAIKVCFMPNE
jgi:threonine dehydrogenase-like Zn-dependent dehydrogenase